MTDSTADLPAPLRDGAGITVVPLDVRFGDETFRDGDEITPDAFLDRLRRSRELPTTSQPPPARFEAAFRRLARDHDAVVAVCISSKLSGTLQSAAVAAATVRDLVPVELVDSRSASMGLGLQALRAADLAAAGMPAPAIAERLRAEVEDYHLVFAVDTLEFLQRGGRIGRAAALIGGMLQLKPLLRVDEGQVVPFERTRTRGRAREGLIDFVAGLPGGARVAALYSSDRADAERLADGIAAATAVPRDAILLAQIGPVLAAHTGPGAMGVAVFEGAAVQAAPERA